MNGARHGVDGKIFLGFLFSFQSTSATNRCRVQYIKFNSVVVNFGCEGKLKLWSLNAWPDTYDDVKKSSHRLLLLFDKTMFVQMLLSVFAWRIFSVAELDARLARFS